MDSEEDMIAIFSSQNHDGEMEAMAVQGVLESNGFDAQLVGTSTLPSLEFQVQVPKSQVADAREMLEKAKLAGPDAALEGEMEGEREIS
jgi:hypothetical protein